jgi:Na+-driven multidrug efflux pump
MVYMQIKKQKSQILKESWIAITRSSLNKFCEYTKIAFDSFLLYGLHNFSYLIIVSFAGWLGVKEYAAITFLNIFSLQIVFFHMSFSYALSALIGQYLGAYEYLKAKRIMVVSMITCFLMLCVINLILYFNIEKILSYYTQDKQVIELAKVALQAYLSYGSLAEMLMNNLCGAIRGLGK